MSGLLHRRHFRRFAYRTLHGFGPLAQPPWRQISAIGAIVLAVAAVSYLIPSSRPRSIAKPAPVVTTSTDHPSEAPITTAYQSTATGDQPKYIHLPTINTQGYIQAVGIDQHHQVAVPTNIHLAGWFVNSVTPGDPGLSIIDGHLDGYRLPGIFASLGRLKPGDRFSVDLANGRTRTFQVKTVQSLPTAQAASTLFSQDPSITRQLNLITCSGTFVKSAAAYDQRVIVTAEYITP